MAIILRILESASISINPLLCGCFSPTSNCLFRMVKPEIFAIKACVHKSWKYLCLHTSWKSYALFSVWVASTVYLITATQIFWVYLVRRFMYIFVNFWKRYSLAAKHFQTLITALTSTSIQHLLQLYQSCCVDTHTAGYQINSPLYRTKTI